MISPARFLPSKLPLKWLKRAGSATIVVLCLNVLWQKAQTLEPQTLAFAFSQTHILQWMGALCATWISYIAFGRFEAVWHDVRGTDLSKTDARRLGMAAAAISQTFGFGAITGAMARLRIMARSNLSQTLGLSAAVSLSFMVCLALIAVPLAAFAGIPISPVLWIIIAMGAAVIGFNLLRMRAQVWTELGPKNMLKLLGFTMLDVVAAGSAFYLLLPATVTIPPAIVIAAFAIALGAGLISNAPGGLGAFDLTICMLLAPLGDSTVIVTLMAFRLVNHLIPAIFALVWVYLARPRKTSLLPPPFAPADWGLYRQGARILQTGRALWLIRTPFGLRIAIGAGFGANPADQIAAARGRRRTDAGLAAIYKISGRAALAARQAGWRVRRIASEAMIDLAAWDMTIPARKRLRRNVRQAEKAGVTISFEVKPADWPELAQVATIWAKNHKGELGFSMGRFDRAYMAEQAICIIRHQDRIIGFLSLHRGAFDWSLDLIRHVPNIPEGTMHLAICGAIDHASRTGAQQLSLGAVPFASPGDRIGHYIAIRRAGLTRFKTCFRPRWVPLYFAAPNPALFVISGMAIFLAIQRPLHRWLWMRRARYAIDVTIPHKSHERFSIEPIATTWQAVRNTPRGPHPF